MHCREVPCSTKFPVFFILLLRRWRAAGRVVPPGREWRMRTPVSRVSRIKAVGL